MGTIAGGERRWAVLEGAAGAVTAVTGCKSTTSNRPTADSRVAGADASVRLDTRSVALNDVGSSIDSDPTPRGEVGCNRPKHLTSNVLPEVEIECWLSARYVPEEQVVGLLKENFALLLMPERTKLSGSWKNVDTSRIRQLNFVPEKPLKLGRGYLIEITPQPLLTPNRQMSDFHVGSLPRVVGVKFGSTTGKLDAPLDLLGITFSENIDTKLAYRSIVVRKQGDAGALELSPIEPTAPQNPGIAFIAAQPFEEQAVYEIELPSSISTALGVSFDTDYDGKAGGSPQVITVRPADYNAKTDQSWTPILSY